MPDIDLCLEIANKELSRHTESLRHWSFIFQGRRLLAHGRNRLGEPTGFFRFGYQPRRHGLHAEVVAFGKARGLLDLRRPWSLVNIRLTAAGRLACSSPCPICLSFVQAAGCREIIHTVDDHFVKFI